MEKSFEISFDKECKRKLLHLIQQIVLLQIIMYIDLGLKFLLLMPKWKVFCLKKIHSDVMGFQLQ